MGLGPKHEKHSRYLIQPDAGARTGVRGFAVEISRVRGGARKTCCVRRGIGCSHGKMLEPLPPATDFYLSVLCLVLRPVKVKHQEYDPVRASKTMT